MAEGAQRLSEAWTELPEEWTEVETGLSLDFASHVLNRFKKEAFWEFIMEEKA